MNGADSHLPTSRRRHTDPAAGALPRPVSRPARSEWLFLTAVLVLMALAYQPAWFGTLLWDDDHHLTPPGLRSLHGLWRIWTDVGATPQYYPLLHSTFWIQQRLWGEAVLGYHLLNLVLHGAAAALVMVTLRRLAIPGAALAAAVFALHPVQVESVAWITELKNTQSTVFYFLAALSYLRFAETGRRRSYAASLVWFTLALLSKTVTGMLPFALLVVLWWQHGRVRVRQDVVPLLPFVVLGVSMGLLTAWWEIAFNRTGTAAFELTLVERGLVASRAALFQLSSLFWPAGLLFSYPRWDIDAGVWWQYLYPVALVLLIAAGWMLRQRSRAPLAALLFFVISLAPTLGVFNLYTFRYSFVADHYQYVACLGIIALIAGGTWRWISSPSGRTRAVATAAWVVVLFVMAGLTWRQSHHYASAEASYAAILRGHPDSWFAHANMGALELNTDPHVAVTHLQQALRLNPDLAEAHGNLGIAFMMNGRLREAVAACERALALNPNLPGAHHTLGEALRLSGRLDDAVAHYEAATRLRPEDGRLHGSLGQILIKTGRSEDGLRHLRSAIALQPDSADARNQLGFAFADLGRLDEAAEEHRRALQLDSASAAAHYGLGNVYQSQDRPTEAVAAYQAALSFDRDAPDTYNNLGVAFNRLGRTAEAERAFRSALSAQPGFADAAYNLAELLARTNRLAESASLSLELLRHDPAASDVRLLLASVLLQMGRRNEAIVQFREVLRRRPDDPVALRGLKQLIR